MFKVPESSRDQDHSSGSVVGLGEERFKIPFGVGLASSPGNSCMSGFLLIGSFSKTDGMLTVRGRSFPLLAMLGVAICRDKGRLDWASIRWIASSVCVCVEIGSSTGGSSGDDTNRLERT